MSIIKVPLGFVEAVADLRLPPKADLRLQRLRQVFAVQQDRDANRMASIPLVHTSPTTERQRCQQQPDYGEALHAHRWDPSPARQKAEAKWRSIS